MKKKQSTKKNSIHICGQLVKSNRRFLRYPDTHLINCDGFIHTDLQHFPFYVQDIAIYFKNDLGFLSHYYYLL